MNIVKSKRISFLKRNIREVKFLLSIMLLMYCGSLQAQDKLILLMEEQTGFSSQTWFYCGLGNELDLKLIEKHWNEGRRITSAAYTSNGWFVTMAKNSGLTWQACHYDSNWPTDWLAEHRKNNRYITSIGMSANKWFIVVSEGTGYTDQINNCGDWDQMSQWIKKYWNEDFRITHAARHTSGWDIVMSKNSGIDQQTYCFATESELKSKLEEQWANGYCLQLIEFANGQYFIIGCTYKNGKAPMQSYNISPDDPGTCISEGWDNQRNIVYIGGGFNFSTPNTGSNQQLATNNNLRNNEKYTEYNLPYMGGTLKMRIYPDGSGNTITETPCRLCYSSGRCSVCNGAGQYWHAYFKTWNPCPSCMGSKVCKYCQGKGQQTMSKYFAPGEAEAYLKAKRAEKGGNPGSNQNRNSNPQYTDEIYWTPNYTGKPYADEWCAKCQKWMQPHKHIRKRL